MIRDVNKHIVNMNQKTKENIMKEPNTNANGAIMKSFQMIPKHLLERRKMQKKKFMETLSQVKVLMIQ